MSEERSPLISVIVPVYKAEKYLHRCVDSLLAQTFRDFEILLVDDGSPDRSGEICDDYAKKDSRVRVFHKENGGVSSARQCGMDNARGEYTIHADPDDWVEPEMLEELYKKAKEDDADMVICDFYEEYRDKVKYIKQRPSSLNHEVVLRELFLHLHGSCWNKLIRRSCYKKWQVIFPQDISFCEDLYVNISLLKNEILVTYISRAYYHYLRVGNENSLVSHYDKSTFYKDKMLMTCLLQKTLNTSSYSLSVRYVSYLMLCRSFVNNRFTSVEYKDNCFRYRRFMLNYTYAPLYMRLFLYFSCIGFYSLSYSLYRIMRYFRSL